ncbi:CHASE domain-containing protein, partial [Candidatus Gracilibacteria bacterium]|nr:CHASE domain-containing protein [Candidatus Gracilibacteria bacterium]
YPGIQGIGFSQVIQSEEKENFVTSVRNEGFPDFRITPEGERDIYTSIVFLEPFDQRNKRAFGYDMFSESTRREAMIRARDTGLPALSEKVILKQETDVDIQNGFLLYVPVYKNNTSLSGLPRGDIFGYVYAPFRVNDFVSSLFNELDYSISFQIFDGLRVVPGTQLYKSPSFPNEDGEIIYRDIKSLSIAGRPWTIEFVNSPTFQRNTIYVRLAYGIIILGFLVSVLVSFVVYSLMASRKKAVQYAQKVNRKLVKNIHELELTRDTALEALQDVEIQKDKFQKANIRLKLATRSAKIGVWEWDIVKDNLIWDAQMYTLYGYKKEDFSGKPYDAWYATIHPDDKERVSTELQYSLRTKQVFDTKFRIVCPDNSLRDIRAFGLVETDDKHKPVHMVGVNWDITHEALVDRQKTEFVSIASHQLRTPLTSIGWYTEMMLHGDTGKTSPAQKKYLNEIYKSHTAMVDLVNKLLSVSRIDLGTLMVDSKVTNMNDIVRDIISENKKKISLNKILIREHIGQVGECLSDPTLVRIIFQNLIANAIKYTPQGGKIDISLSLKGKNILFKITDNGRGIPEEQQKDIFHKFFRANNTKDVNGTGLGLYIVRSIAEKLGGKVWFESGTRGTKKGTTFSVQLPFIPNKQNPIKKSS